MNNALIAFLSSYRDTFSTSISTSETGSLHHRISKVLESTCVAHDGSVRNCTGAIFQLVCSDGFEAGQMIPTNCDGLGAVYSFIDIKDTVKSLNHNLETRLSELNYSATA